MALWSIAVRATPLHMAAKKGHLGVIKTLLVHEADIDAKADRKFNVLPSNLSLAWMNSLRMYTICASDGSTPLREAVMFGRLEAATYLVGDRANLNVKDEGDSAIGTVLVLSMYRYRFALNVFVCLIGLSNHASRSQTAGRFCTWLHCADISKSSSGWSGSEPIQTLESVNVSLTASAAPSREYLLFSPLTPCMTLMHCRW